MTDQTFTPQPTILPLLDLSTGHLTRETARFLSETPIELWPVSGGRTLYGYLISVPEKLTSTIQADLLACLAFARQHNCPYILFDRDAAHHPELQRYDW